MGLGLAQKWDRQICGRIVVLRHVSCICIQRVAKTAVEKVDLIEEIRKDFNLKPLHYLE